MKTPKLAKRDKKIAPEKNPKIKRLEEAAKPYQLSSVPISITYRRVIE